MRRKSRADQRYWQTKVQKWDRAGTGKDIKQAKTQNGQRNVRLQGKIYFSVDKKAKRVV